MTPAIRLLKQKKILFEICEYEHDSNNKEFGKEAASKLGLNEKEVFKTLLVDIGQKDFVVVMVPVDKQVSLKEVARFYKAKKATLAQPLKAQNITGYLVGGISPLGQKKLLRTLIDSSAKELGNIYVSGGKRGLDIKIGFDDLMLLTKASVYDIST